MKNKLPEPLGAFFTATNAHDVAAMSAAFIEDAVVHDEGRQHRGLTTIRDWMRSTIDKYDYQIEPLESSRTGAQTVVLVSVRGKFPGSPVTLQYQFTLDGKRIARLEIG